MSPLELLANASGPIHFMGVAGAGMISLAELLLRSGREVTGCDAQADPAARALASFGGVVFQGHDPSHVEGAVALVVTPAVPADHPEILRALELGIPVLKRAELLGKWVSQGRTVAVAGTHGKTTTTAMATEMFAAAGMNPTGFVGGRVNAWASNLRFGGSDLFVVEADEYDRSFHHLHPQVAVVTNLEADHLDIYGDLQGVWEAFTVFLEGVAPDGHVAVCGDDHGASALLPALGERGCSYGLNPGSQLRAVEIRENGKKTVFQVVERGVPRGELTLRVPGIHNVRNALGAAAAARFLGVGWDQVREGLKGFKGVGRRFQLLGAEDGITVVDDYAHHPTEIRATLSAARTRFPGRRIIAVFQPHLYSRTRDFATEFGQALAAADEVWVSDVYPAREAPIPGVSGVLVAQATLDAGAEHVFYHPNLSEFAHALMGSLRPGDVCITLGAGSIEFLGGDILAALRGPGWDDDGEMPE
jgi:UDP-N-acetylmuramate--alanine ligase